MELALVIGGGNILRGAHAAWISRVKADAIGMSATVVNALALQAGLEARGRSVIVQSAILAEGTGPVDPRGACEALAAGTIVLFAGGTGNPYVTTDTAAAIRAASIDAELLAKGSDVNGVYDADPQRSDEARWIDALSYEEFLNARYGVMDLMAIEICRGEGIPVLVFDSTVHGSIRDLLEGRLPEGTRIGA
jgi:uridylate kinase